MTARQRRTPRHLQGRVAGAALVGLVDYRLLIAVAVVVLALAGLRLLARPAVADDAPGREPALTDRTG